MTGYQQQPVTWDEQTGEVSRNRQLPATSRLALPMQNTLTEGPG